jgi:hypothetical protein
MEDLETWNKRNAGPKKLLGLNDCNEYDLN